MEQYLTHTDYALWEVIVNGDVPAVALASTKGPIPPKTAEQKIARKNELKAKSNYCSNMRILLHQDLKDWTKFMIGFKNSSANWKFKPNKDALSMMTYTQSLKVYKAESKIQSSSNSNSQNVAFVSSENTSSTNEAVNTTLDVSTVSTQGQASSSTYVDDVMFSFFVNQSKSPLLDNEDMEQIDSDDPKEMDLKWQVAMLTMRIKRFMMKTRKNLNLNGKEVVGLNMKKVECYNCHRKCHFARDCRAPRNQGKYGME
ncbi:ribonuclease H-like domain-containing protein [Tanacetum coccineum]